MHDAERRAAGWLHDGCAPGARGVGRDALGAPAVGLSLALQRPSGWWRACWRSRPRSGAGRRGIAAVSMAVEAAGAPSPAAALPSAGDAERGHGARRGGGRAAHLRPLHAPPAGSGRGSSLAGRRWIRGRASPSSPCAPGWGCELEGLWLGLLQFVPTLVLLLALAAAGDTAVSSPAPDGETPPAVAVALHDELRRNPPDRLSPALLLHGALRSHLRRERPDRRRIVVLELGPGAAVPPRTRNCAPRRRRGARRRRARRTRLPTLQVGASAERTLDFALACVDAVDADLLDATRLH